MHKFISDLGAPVTFKAVTDPPEAQTLTVPRYGVWAPVNGRLQVIDTGDDLEALRTKYDIQSEVVLIVPG